MRAWRELWRAGEALGQPGLAGGKGASESIGAIEEFMTLLNLMRNWQRVVSRVELSPESRRGL